MFTPVCVYVSCIIIINMHSSTCMHFVAVCFACVCVESSRSADKKRKSQMAFELHSTHQLASSWMPLNDKYLFLPFVCTFGQLICQLIYVYMDSKKVRLNHISHRTK